MKKLIVLIAAVAMSATMAMAQNNTRIGSEHKVNFGAYLGNAFVEADDVPHIRNYGAALMDINASKCNYRTRLALGWLERTHVCPFATVDAQYLFPIAKSGLYVYPSLGVRAEMFHDEFNVGPEVAAGLEYQFNHRFGIFAEAGYQYNFLNEGVSRVAANYGVKFAFGKSNSAKAAAAAAAAAAIEAERAAAEAARAKAEAEAKAKAEAEAAAAAAKAKAEAEAAEARAAAMAYDAAKNTVGLVYFLINQIDIRECEEGKVSQLADVLKKYPNLKVSIVGHADKETGYPKLNMKLSEGRANMVAAALESLGISADRISVDFKGDTENPFDTPETNRVAICTVSE